MDLAQSIAAGDKDWDRLYHVIGRITVTLNSAHWCVFELMGILQNTDREDTAPIFYSLRADKAQRELTQAIAKNRLRDPREQALLTEINQAIDELGKIAGKRNSFIHTHWTMSHGSDGYQFTTAENVPVKLNLENPFADGDNLLERIDHIIDDLLDLCGRAERAPSVEKLHSQTGPRHNRRTIPTPTPTPRT